MLIARSRTSSAHDEKKDWQFFRDAAKDMLWPRIEQEYRDELQGIADGVNAHGVKLDLWDIVAINAWLEWGYYTKWLDKQQGKPVTAAPRRALQRLRRHRQLHEGRPAGHRPQQLDQLHVRRALEHHLRYRAAARATTS